MFRNKMVYRRYVDDLGYTIFKNMRGAFIMSEVNVEWLLARDKIHFYRKLSDRFRKTFTFFIVNHRF